jgi:pimeloyl-ACP methyl ester carboxylesterase
MDTAADDQLETLAVFSGQFGTPARTLALGTSMGGLVTGQLAERPDAGIDGALATCGLMQGGVDLLNYQLDGAHAVAQLLVPPGQDVQLADFAGSREAAGVSVQTMLTALEAAQGSPAGRARTALAAALHHLPRWAEGLPEPAPDDVAAQERAQYLQFVAALRFTYPGRVDIEGTVGGNPSWNVGVDYRALLEHADERAQVEALYREAGLDLADDLDRLTGTAAVSADPEALAASRAISELTGDLQVPVLSIHTTHDVLAPVQVEEEYAEQVRQAGAEGLLRQAFVHRLGWSPRCTRSRSGWRPATGPRRRGPATWTRPRRSWAWAARSSCPGTGPRSGSVTAVARWAAPATDLPGGTVRVGFRRSPTHPAVYRALPAYCSRTSRTSASSRAGGLSAHQTRDTSTGGASRTGR